MRLRKLRLVSFCRKNFTAPFFIAIIVLFCFFITSRIVFKITKRHRSFKEERTHRSVSAERNRRLAARGQNLIQKLLAVDSVVGKAVNISVPVTFSRGAGLRSLSKDHTGVFARDRLAPMSETGLLFPGSEEEVVTRKLHALRFRKIVSPHEYRYTIEPSGVCSQREAVEMVVAVMVAARHSKTRQYFRQHVWGGHGATFNRAEKVVLLFFLGVPPDARSRRALQNESQIHNDVVQASFPDPDASSGGTLKAISTLKWVSSRCPSAKFLIIANEECLVNVPMMLEELQLQRSVAPIFILGKAPAPLPLSPSSGRFRTNRRVDYLEESCVGLPMSAARLLYEAALRVSVVGQANVLLTGLCASLVNIDRFDNRAFRFSRVSPKARNTTSSVYRRAPSHARHRKRADP